MEKIQHGERPMNTPEPFSQPWDKRQQPLYPPGYSHGKNTPYPFIPPTSQVPSWNGPGMPGVAGNLGMPNVTGRENSGYLPPSNPFTSSPATANSWGNQWTNGTNTTGRENGSNGFSPSNTPISSNNTSALHAKSPHHNTSLVGKILLFVGLALFLVTASIAGVYMLSGSASTASNTAKAKATTLPIPTPTVHMQHEQTAAQYVANMSLDDEIAQLLMVEHYDATYSPDLNIMMNQQHVGSVILYKSAIVTRAQVENSIGNMQKHSTIPVFVSIDEEGWNVGRLGVLYPNYYTYRKDANTIGLIGDHNVASQQGQQAGKDLLSLGINMNLAPDVDVSTDDGYIGYDRRSFGSTPDAVIKYAGPYLNALQTAGVVGSIKHFPGL